jgi:hypothetical protein
MISKENEITTNNQVEKIKELLKNDPLISSSENSSQKYINKAPPYVLKKIPEPINQIEPYKFKKNVSDNSDSEKDKDEKIVKDEKIDEKIVKDIVISSESSSSSSSETNSENNSKKSIKNSEKIMCPKNDTEKNNISESTTGLSSEIKNRKAFTRVNTQGDKSEAKINSTEEAIEKLMAGGIEVQIIASDTSEKKYLINTGRSTRYIYKDDELMEYAKDFSLIKNQDEN